MFTGPLSAVHSSLSGFGNLTLRAHMALQYGKGVYSVEQIFVFETRLWQLAMQKNGAAVTMLEVRAILDAL